MKWRSHPRFAIAAPQPFPTNVLLVPMMRAVRSSIASAIILAFAWVSFCSQSCFAPDLTASSCPIHHSSDCCDHHKSSSDPTGLQDFTLVFPSVSKALMMPLAPCGCTVMVSLSPSYSSVYEIRPAVRNNLGPPETSPFSILRV